MTHDLPKRLSVCDEPGVDLITDETATIIAHTLSRSSERSRAIAAELVRRWNAHEELVAALRKVGAFVAAELAARIDSHTLGGNFETLDEDGAAIIGEATDALAMIDAALAKVGA